MKHLAVALALPLLLALALTSCSGGGSSEAGGRFDLYDHPDLELYDNEHTTAEQIHLLGNQTADYTVLPPYGEEHSPIPLACGIYSSTPMFEMVVHAMEHGAVALWYTPSSFDQDGIQALTEISTRHLNDRDYVIQAPYGGLGSPIMLVAWGVRLPLNDVNEDLIEQFFDEFHDEAPEPLAAGGCATAR